MIENCRFRPMQPDDLPRLHAMREAGMRVATVGTGGDASHVPARRAYEKAGFGPAIPSLYLYRSL